MKIGISLRYNASDSMTDYYNPNAMVHSSVEKDNNGCLKSFKWSLGEIAGKRRDLKKLRQLVEKYPLLRKLEWKEHREDWSMNHFGYCLTSDSFDIKEILDIENTNVERGFFEVQFYCDDDTLKFLENPEEVKQKSKTIFQKEEITISRNLDKNGIEIRFKEKPSLEVLSQLKENGFRWSKFNFCWYKKYYDDVEADIEKLLNIKVIKELDAVNPETSLYSVIQSKNEAGIRYLEKKSNEGKIIRII